MPGSSPLTRGKPALVLVAHCARRLIPTHAGKTRPALVERGFGRAHPHSRGENFASASTVLKKPGSSPLTRGKPRPPTCYRVGGRLIPTHAGKTACRVVPDPAKGAHPHSRGENATM